MVLWDINKVKTPKNQEECIIGEEVIALAIRKKNK